MRQRRLHNLVLLNLILALFLSIGIHEVLLLGGFSRLSEDTVTKDGFRRQTLNEEVLSYIQNTKDPVKDQALYLLETDFGRDRLDS